MFDLLVAGTDAFSAVPRWRAVVVGEKFANDIGYNVVADARHAGLSLSIPERDTAPN
jgi:hypothetical protein